MFEDLERIGFMQNKTHILAMPDVPPIFFSHFVRGYFDGDGNVWKGTIHTFDRPHPSQALKICFTSGSEKFLYSLKAKLRIFTGTIGGSLYYSRAFRLQYASFDSLKIYQFMYRDKRDMYLRRKKNTFDSFVKKL
jgi:hypothetical protein